MGMAKFNVRSNCISPFAWSRVIIDSRPTDFENGLREEFLADAALARDQHREGCACMPTGRLEGWLNAGLWAARLSNVYFAVVCFLPARPAA